MKTVRVRDGRVVEIIPDYALPVEKWYGKKFAEECIVASDDVEIGWAYDEDGLHKFDPDILVSDAEKMERIAQSKNDLEQYLLQHPLLWTDGKYYSITAEKQAQLTSKLAVAQAKKSANIPYDLKWNTTEEVCTSWDIDELFKLAFAIDERVTKLVSYQQEKEVAIRNSKTESELDAIVIDYDTVQ